MAKHRQEDRYPSPPGSLPPKQVRSLGDMALHQDVDSPTMVMGRVEAEAYTPKIISREPFREGGYTFLKRALRTALDDKRGQVVINTGNLMLTYVFDPTNNDPERQTFMDGVQSVEGDNPGALEAFRGVASQYDIQQGLAELAREREQQGPR